MSEPHPNAARERELVRAARTGDRGAFVALARSHQRVAYGVAFAVVRDRENARRLAVDALVRAWRDRAQLADDESFAAWLARRTLRQARSQEGRPAPPFRGGPPPGAHPAALERCEEAFTALTPEHRDVLVLRLAVGLGYPDLAAALGVPLAVAVARVSAARAAMLARLGSGGPLE